MKQNGISLYGQIKKIRKEKKTIKLIDETKLYYKFITIFIIKLKSLANLIRLFYPTST